MLISTILKRLKLEVKIIRKRILILHETRVRGGIHRRSVDRLRRIHRIKKEKETYAERILSLWVDGVSKPSTEEINEVMFYPETISWERLKNYEKKYSSCNI